MRSSDSATEMTSTHARRWMLAVGSTLVIVAILICAFVWLTSTQVNWTVAMVQRLIETDLPNDASREQVEAWLDKHGIAHGYRTGVVEDFNRNWVADEVGLTNAEVSGTIRGTIREAERGLLFVKEIRIYFFFDHKGYLRKHWLDTFVYGL